ncbi:hypothetical protein Hanom_Chr05g00473571 [Helianthus anomalus]
MRFDFQGQNIDPFGLVLKPAGQRSGEANRDVNEPNEHEQGLVRVYSLRNEPVHELFTNEISCSCSFNKEMNVFMNCSRTFTERSRT